MFIVSKILQAYEKPICVGFDFKMIFHYLLKLLLNTFELWNDLGELISCFKYLMGRGGKLVYPFPYYCIPKNELPSFHF